jgi:CheY-like chemotaxis protein
MTGYGDKSSTVRLTILLVEDDPDTRSMLASVLRRDGHRTVEIEEGPRLEAQLSSVAVARSTEQGILLIVDFAMSGNGRLSLLDRLATDGRLPPFMGMSASADDRLRQEVARLGAIAFFDKPFDFDDLRRAVRMVQRDFAGA